MTGRVTDSEAAARSLTIDHVTLDEDGCHVFTNYEAEVEWDLTSELHPNPPLPAFYGIAPRAGWRSSCAVSLPDRQE